MGSSIVQWNVDELCQIRYQFVYQCKLGVDFIITPTLEVEALKEMYLPIVSK